MSAKKALLALDPMERRFVELYVDTNNAHRSAVAAGYSPKSARTLASRLLKRVDIREAVEVVNAEMLAELDFTPDRIVREIAKVAGVNSADFIAIDEATGLPIVDFSTVTRRQLAAIASVENTDKGVKYKAHDKLKALDMLARMAKIYPSERTEITGRDGGPIQTANLHAHAAKINIEDLDLEQREQLRGVLLALKSQRDKPGEES